MDALLSFLTSTLVVIFIVIAPGPDTTLVIKNSLLKSRKDGFATTLGIVLGNTLYVSVGLVGIGALIVGSPLIFSIVRYTGALYMAYIGIRLLFSKKSEQAVSGVHGESNFWKSFREGLLTNLSNPKFLLFFLAFFAQFITPETPFYLQALIAYQLSIIAFIWFSVLSFLLTTSAVKTRIAPFLRYVELATGVILIAFAVFAFSGA
jgi:RhtB (resistance to homoserine/threonine) family protein